MDTPLTPFTPFIPFIPFIPAGYEPYVYAFRMCCSGDCCACVGDGDGEAEIITAGAGALNANSVSTHNAHHIQLHQLQGMTGHDWA